MDDVGEEYARVTYYMVLYGTDDQTLDEQVLGMLFWKPNSIFFRYRELVRFYQIHPIDTIFYFISHLTETELQLEYLEPATDYRVSVQALTPSGLKSEVASSNFTTGDITSHNHGDITWY